MAQHNPSPRPLSDQALSELLSRRMYGTLATVRGSGHPHLTTMLYHWDPRTRVVRFTSRTGRAKVTHLRRDPRAALHVQGDDVWSFATAEGEAEVSEVTTVPGDAVGRELLEMLPDAHRPRDEAEFLRGLVDEQRVVIRLHVHRLYGTALDVG